MSNLAQLAINAALCCDWNKAISINKSILQENETDIGALSRLAYALMQLGKIAEAKKKYRKILSADRFNYIAQKNLDRINSLPKMSKREPNLKVKTSLSPNLFLEEPGKTKSITLTNIAPANVCSGLRIGDFVTLHPKKHSIEVRDQNKTYLGALPDDIAFRLIRFLKSGNVYETCIKNVQKKSIAVFIREVKRGKRFRHQPTFITSSREYNPSTPKVSKISTAPEDQDKEENQELDE